MATSTYNLFGDRLSVQQPDTLFNGLYGLRFHDFGVTARPMGQYLFEPFTPQTNRAGLALPYEWNGMTGIQQYQIAPGTTLLRSDAAAQISYGAQYTGGANQMFVLSPWNFEMNSAIIVMIEEAIDAVGKSIAAHKAGVQAPLSLTMLLRIHVELENMRKYLSPKSYTPSYQRFVMDWPDETGLIKKLMNVAYEYNKAKS